MSPLDTVIGGGLAAAGLTFIYACIVIGITLGVTHEIRDRIKARRAAPALAEKRRLEARDSAREWDELWSIVAPFPVTDPAWRAFEEAHREVEQRSA